jgi:hypothetical protein
MSRPPRARKRSSPGDTAVSLVLFERCDVMARDHVQHVRSQMPNVSRSLCNLPEVDVPKKLEAPAPISRLAALT